MKPTETAFFEYLRSLNEHDRFEHLLECMFARGEMVVELADFFKEWHPRQLSKLIGEYKDGEKNEDA